MVKEAGRLALDEEKEAHQQTKQQLAIERSEHERAKSLLFSSETALRLEREQQNELDLARYASLCAAYVTEQAQMKEQHAATLSRMKVSHAKELAEQHAALTGHHAATLSQMKDSHEKELEAQSCTIRSANMKCRKRTDELTSNTRRT